MKRIQLIGLLFLGFELFSLQVLAQSADGGLKLKELAVPNSPAFILLDIAPTLIEAPLTPKEFAFAAIQSFSDDAGLPQNYSMEFTPYWWLNAKKRNVYEFAGITKTSAGVFKENVFSGLKFSNFSVAFVNKDLIPDTSAFNQKIFSIGVNTTLLKIHNANYAAKLNSEIDNWHKEIQKELAIMQDKLNQESDPAKRRVLQQELNDTVFPVSSKIAENINDIIKEHPLFILNFSAAYAVYGIDNRYLRNGRSGAWATLASFLPMKSSENSANSNYLNLIVSSRYMHDNYSIDENNMLAKTSSFDLGGKIAFEFNRVLFGFESLQRTYTSGTNFHYSRNAGTISYRLNNNLFINGTFGKDFGLENKIITLFGFNWGFGEEKINLPDPGL
ncbi:MAG: hypothetical protein ABI390_00230 [Daejeonella sp.]